MIIFWIIIFGVLGAIWGSFINAVGGRLLAIFFADPGASLSTGLSLRDRSVCFSCGNRLGVMDLVPILSFSMSGGQSRCCKQRLPLNYLMAEVFFLGLAVLLALLGIPLFMAINILILFSVLYLLVLSDFRFFEVPIYFLVFLWLCAACALVFGGLGPVFEGMLRAVFAFLLLFLPGLVTSRLLGRDSLGLADPVVFSALAVYLELDLVPYFLLLTSTVGIAWWVATGRGGRIPFIPAISIAFFLCFVFSSVSWRGAVL